MHPKIREWPFVSFRALSCRLRRKSRQRATVPWSSNVISYRTAIFRQVNKNRARAHHDALEFPGGQVVLLTTLRSGQQATVLQLPAAHQQEGAKASEAEKALVLTP